MVNPVNSYTEELFHYTITGVHMIIIVYTFVIYIYIYIPVYIYVYIYIYNYVYNYIFYIFIIIYTLQTWHRVNVHEYWYIAGG